jgi:hypothetical protein
MNTIVDLAKKHLECFDEYIKKGREGIFKADIIKLIKTIEGGSKSAVEAIVRQGDSQPVQAAGSNPTNFEFSGLTKQEKDELILGAMDNVQNPKRDVTFEQASWLRFASYLRKKGWYIAKF